MTAVAMIFEMTRDYDIVLPMILAVAVGLGVRRLLSRENIYTMKLVRRGHPIPKALHANMFLVRSARDVMDRDFVLVDEATSFDAFLRMSPDVGRHAPRGGDARQPDRRRAAGEHRRCGGPSARVRTTSRSAPWHSGTLRSCARRSAVFDVIARLGRRKAVMGVVVEGQGRPRAATWLASSPRNTSPTR